MTVLEARDTPPAYAEFARRVAELADLDRIGGLLFWDRATNMPPDAAPARAEQSATLETVRHAKLVDSGLARLLEDLAVWERDADPDSDAVRLVRVMRRDHEKAARVPGDLAADMARAAGLGEAAWLRARAAGNFSLYRDELARNVELRRRYAALFPEVEHPYDVLLDDFEPGLTSQLVGALFGELRERLVPLAARARTHAPAVTWGPYSRAAQERAVRDVLGAMGFDAGSWRLDETAHPFAQSLGRHDVRITTHYDDADFARALYGTLHEFGHGLYEDGVEASLDRTPLGDPGSLGLHESQSRLWENALGRSLPFCEWAQPRLGALLGGPLAALTPEEMFRATNRVEPSLIRIMADETTYNLHVVLRYELERDLFAGELEVDALPVAWNAGMHDLLGVEVPSDAEGVMQDIHWAAGLIGYFPTYALGNLGAAQLWWLIRRDLPGLDAQIRSGEFTPLREWLREHVHRHGRRFTGPELIERITGGPLQVAPLIEYLEDKLYATGALTAAG